MRRRVKTRRLTTVPSRTHVSSRDAEMMSTAAQGGANSSSVTVAAAAASASASTRGGARGRARAAGAAGRVAPAARPSRGVVCITPPPPLAPWTGLRSRRYGRAAWRGARSLGRRKGGRAPAAGSGAVGVTIGSFFALCAGAGCAASRFRRL
jgi:hypothetical protein